MMLPPFQVSTSAILPKGDYFDHNININKNYYQGRRLFWPNFMVYFIKHLRGGQNIWMTISVIKTWQLYHLLYGWQNVKLCFADKAELLNINRFLWELYILNFRRLSWPNLTCRRISIWSVCSNRLFGDPGQIYMFTKFSAFSALGMQRTEMRLGACSECISVHVFCQHNKISGPIPQHDLKISTSFHEIWTDGYWAVINWLYALPFAYFYW